MLKVYVPSHKRPDVKLFDFASDLNIVINQEEDIEPYSKWKGKHNIIYRPELKGLLDVRNWILEQNDDWFLMLDDDLLSTKSEELTWDEFIKETENIIYSLDKTEVGIVGYKRDEPKEFYFEEKKDNFTNIYQAVILNSSLLKSNNFKYEGYPFDGANGQRAHLEDSDLIYFCYSNNLKIIQLTKLAVSFDKICSSVAWNDENKEKMIFLSCLWLLDKYRNYPNIKKDINYYFNNKPNNLRNYSKLNFAEEIIEHISRNNFKKDIELVTNINGLLIAMKELIDENL